MEASRAQANRLLESMTAMFLAGTVLIVAVQVICRYILKVSLPWSEEFSRYLFIWGTFLGAAVAFARDSHIRIDSLSRRLPDTVCRRLESVTAAILICFSLLLSI